ncbi:hypothetical protein ACIBP6_27965 [Nonomuraea terrae]|uniref:hypothetical protein n=1 Tax=Nonomuraea terrae TaxID=2530383 RepID=UPI00378A90E1
MGVRGWLLRCAARRPRVLVVACPYGTRARLSVEAELDRRGWEVALSPAEAGVLVVCGRPGEELAEAIGTVRESVPVPRALVELPSAATPDDVSAALDAATATLADERARYATPPARPRHPRQANDPGGAGIAMAERGADRDGLKLDQLHVPLGPVLPDWPAGLVVETVLQGDVIQEATVRVLPPGETGTAFWSEPWRNAGGRPGGEGERRRAAARLDGLGRLLGVAGWAGAALEARGIRDRLLAEMSGAELRPRQERFARRVRRSVVLRWMLRGLGMIEGGSGVPAWMCGDVLDRAYRWVHEAGEAVRRLEDGTPRETGPETAGQAAVALLPGLLEGAEFATARLIVASLDPDLDQVPVRAGHG